MLLLAAAYFSVRSVERIWNYNDFEVAWETARRTWLHGTDIYDAFSAVTERVFVYPSDEISR